jgi:hypothetical protein
MSDGMMSGMMMHLSIWRKMCPMYETYMASRGVHGSSRVFRATPRMTPEMTPIMVAIVRVFDRRPLTTSSLVIFMMAGCRSDSEK